jgi:hypothetical protein
METTIMPKLKKAFVFAAAIVVSAMVPTFTHSALAQSSAKINNPSTKKIYGYQDPQTGEFHALKPAATPDATTAPTTGTVEVTLKITLKTAVPKGGSVICGISLGVEKIFSDGTDSSYEESAATVATVSGSAATCTMTIPYSWIITPGTALEESFGGGYNAEILTETAEPGILRGSDGTYASATTVPASGTTTKYTEDVTL